MDSHLSFRLRRSSIDSGILIPKYYDPEIRQSFEIAVTAGFKLPYLRDLLQAGELGSHLGT
jgi:hypothetical protein